MYNQSGLERNSKCVSPLVPRVPSTNHVSQMMIREQDRAIDSIAGTLSTLAQQAGLMGREIVEHNEFVPAVYGCNVNLTYSSRMLDDIEQGVDRSGAKLDDAMKRMRKFIRDTEETKSGWCIIILVIVLLVLLLAVILI